jgi:plastocyanin
VWPQCDGGYISKKRVSWVSAQKFCLSFLEAPAQYGPSHRIAERQLRFNIKENPERWRAEKGSKTMKRSNAVRGMFRLTIMFAIGFLMEAEAGDRRTSMPQQNQRAPAPIRIVDQNGQPAANGVPSATSTIVDVTVGGGNGFQFVPSTVNISVGDTVRWTWAHGGHSVTSGPPCVADSQYCSPNDMNCASGILSNIGTVYQHTFTQPGAYSYHCAAHCVIGMTGVVNVSGGCAPSGWSAGQNLPSVGVRLVGVYFQANGKFYGMGGRSSDLAGSDFTHPFEYDPVANTWTTKSATYPDNQVNNMACGVLAVSGTPYIYCVGGSAAGATTATARVFFYDPVTDAITALTAADNWPGDAAGTILPGGFAVTGNKLYTLGGFNINVASTNQIWQFDPTAAIGSKWLQKVNTPEGIMYAPTCAIDGIIYVGGASDFQGGTVIDTPNTFSFNPTTNTIGAIPAIPRATGETRALTFNGKMLVMGGGRVAPNPSNEVDVYDPGSNTWTTFPAFMTARRNFPTDTNGTTNIWLSGGYASDNVTPLSSTEVFCQGAAPMAQSAFSRKVHGAAGTFDVPLPLTGNVGVECRTGPTYQMIINFATSVTVQSASVTSGTGTVSSFSVNGSQVTVNLSGVTDQQRITMTLHGVNDGTHMGDVPISMGVLVGDVNGNGTVSSADVALTKSQVGQTVGGSNFREDVNANGVLNAVDVAIVKSDVGHALPP